MKKLIFIFCIISRYIFADINEDIEKEKYKKDKYLEQERLHKELEERSADFKNLNFQEIKEANLNETKFYISKINISDNEKLLNEIEKERILEKYINKELGSTDLTNLLAELTNRLISKGYITTTANISENNDLRTGTLNLEVVYGKIEKINLNDNKTLDKLKKNFLSKSQRR